MFQRQTFNRVDKQPKVQHYDSSFCESHIYI